MNPGRIVVTRREEWRRLASLVERAQKGGLRSLEPLEVREFSHLYRGTAADLARLRTAGSDAETLAYVERLVAGGHNLLYRSEGADEEKSDASGRGLIDFLARRFPRLVRRSRGALALAACIWLCGVLLAFGVATLRPDLARDLCPASYLDRAEAAAAERATTGTARYIRMDAAFVPVFSSALVANNVQATLVAFGLGVTAGLGTAAVLFINGLLFGVVAGVFGHEGVAEVFWTFVLVHGFVEVPAFFIAAAAGLRIGNALLRPGERTRRDALVADAVDAGRLLGGTTAMLVVAAIIEGVVSPSALPASLKVGFGVASGVAVLAWILLGGRETALSAASVRGTAPPATR